MYIGQIAKSFSELFTLPLAKVQSTCRFLREAGFIRSGARGVNAPHLVDLEIARILIALMVSESPSDAVVRCKYFAALPVDPVMSKLSPTQAIEHESYTVETVIASAMKRVREGEFDKAPEGFSFHKGVNLEINISMGTVKLENLTNGARLFFSTEPDPRDHGLVAKHLETLPPFFSVMNRTTSITGGPFDVIAAFGNTGKSKGEAT